MRIYLKTLAIEADDGTKAVFCSCFLSLRMHFSLSILYVTPTGTSNLKVVAIVKFFFVE